MVRTLPVLPVALSGALLLTACGSESAGARQDGRTPAGAARSSGPVGEFSCEPRPPGAASAPSASSTPSASAGGEPAKDGVRITGTGRIPHPCFGFEVTNKEKEALSYTVTFTLLSGSGAALETTKQTVPSVKPGETTQRIVDMRELLPSTQDSARVRITKVRSVPAGEAPSTGGPCPSSGVRVYADEDGDAAMGLRVLALHLENCGTQPYRLNGYPQLQVLDERHQVLSGVETVRGSEVAQSTGADGSPQPMTLQQGERAYAVLVWRNTVGGGDAVNAPYARVRAQSGAAPVTVIPELDLGTTGKLGAGPWKKDDTRAPGAGGASGSRAPDRPSAPTAPVQQ
ncbi:DUF4232 domain-containing protein [Streptomyces sp. VNUA116]|nr:DUF4232 domain-containing protein [Streptomyces sp. VNUA116]WKU49122.1 DUF4232 domain-containing protein [Streptomyces sp. VNUA116]